VNLKGHMDMLLGWTP